MHVLSGYPLFTCHQQWFFSQQTSQGSDRTSPCRSTSKGPLSSNKRTNFSWQLQTKDLTGRADTSGSKNWFRCDWKVMKIWGLYIYIWIHDPKLFWTRPTVADFSTSTPSHKPWKNQYNRLRHEPDIHPEKLSPEIVVACFCVKGSTKHWIESY